MKLIKKILNAITEPFAQWAIITEETRVENLDGRYDKYWARKNRRAEKRNNRKGVSE